MEVYFTANSVCFNWQTDFSTVFCVSDGAEMSSAGWAVLTGRVCSVKLRLIKHSPQQRLPAIPQKANRGLSRILSKIGWKSSPREVHL